MPTPRRARRRVSVLALIATFLMTLIPAVPVAADSVAQTVPFSQNWSNTGLITVDHDWSGVPGITGYRGDDLTTVTGTDPQTIVADGSGTPVNVEANETNPTTFTSGGVAEFHITDAVVALNGSGTADAPHVVLNLSTTGLSNVVVAYNLRDLDGSLDNAVQPIALQYRVGSSGSYTNVPAGFIADATSGPSLATLVTPVSATLPAAVNGQSLVQVRIITANAGGNDEWVGIDDISVTASAADQPPAVQTTTPAAGAVDVAVDSNISITFSEPVDVTGSWFSISCVTSGPHTATPSGGPDTFTLNPDADFALGETCTVTVLAANVTDQDANDPPDNMDANAVSSFTTVGPVTAVTGIYFSEYIEGSSNNKALEIFNGTGAPIDLAAEGWNVQMFFNGATSAGLTINLTGTVAAWDVYVLANSAASAPILAQADLTNSSGWFNGDDAVVLRKGTTIVDVIGQVGVDPGTEWGTGLTSTQDNTLRRKAAITAGDTNPSDAFDPAVEWDGFATDTFDGLGFHGDAPRVVSTTPASGATDVALAANLSITFSEPVNATASSFTISCTASGAHTATVTGGPVTFDLDPDSDFVGAESCTVTVVAANVSDQDADDPPDNMAVNHVFSFATLDVTICGDPATPIHTVQGNGLASPIAGSIVTVEGVVVGDFQGTGQLSGFYLQEEDAQADADPATSEGIFVFGSALADVSMGDVVRAKGTVTEFNGLTELTSVSPMALCSTGNPLPAASQVTLPVTTLDDFERYENMRVRLPQSLVIAEYFNYDQFGEIVLALPLAGETRPFTPTAIDPPGPPAQARALANSLRRITLDDGLSVSNPDVLRHPNGNAFSMTNLFRGGDLVQDTEGVLTYGFNLYRIEPTMAATYTSINPRPVAPEPVGGDLRVAAMNTLNFFLTLDYPTGNSLDNKCGPAQNVECRGADFDQPDEFTRQRTKLLAAIEGLNADVLGLNELENTTGVDALADPTGVVPGLNAALGAGTYASINTGAIGTDAIRVGIIYKPAKVTPVGPFKVLTSAVDPRFIDTRSRPALAQTFEENATGARFTIVVNHLKSKGSACADIGDPDTGDGQGNCNLTRKAAAEAIVDWIATDPTGSGDPDFLIMGDLNSYAREDPITAIKAGSDDTPGTGDDYTNLISTFQGTYAYSYTFDGQAGYLDHALASASILAQVTGAADWHIDSDEADVVDYDTTFKGPGQEALYEPNAYRASDHDPVVVGLDLTTGAPSVDAGGPYSVDEGGSVGVSATGSDPEGRTLTYDWDLDNDGVFETPGQNATFSAASIDGPTTWTIQVRATDPGGAVTVDSATVDVTNVAPSATFDSPASVLAGFSFTLSLTSPSDPSVADTAAGFEYAFDCGSGYGAFNAASSVTCTTSTSGSLSVGGQIRDKDGDTSEYLAIVTVGASARSTIEAVLAQVNALSVGAGKPDAGKLDKAADALTKALDPNLWVDPMHVVSKDGVKVFDRLKDAVQPLRDLLKDKKSTTPDATLQGMIDDLVGASAMLARTAVDDAIAAGAPADKVARATDELAKGDAAAAKGDAHRAIDHYKAAWHRAQDAMK